MTEQIKKKVWLYCRSARDEGNPLESQLCSLTAYAEAKDYQVVGVSQEIDSGLALDRSELNKIKAFKKNMIDGLIVKYSARIGRNVLNTNVFLDMMERKGIETILLDEESTDESDVAELTAKMFRSLRTKEKDTLYLNKVSSVNVATANPNFQLV